MGSYARPRASEEFPQADQRLPSFGGDQEAPERVETPWTWEPSETPSQSLSQHFSRPPSTSGEAASKSASRQCSKELPRVAEASPEDDGIVDAPWESSAGLVNAALRDADELSEGNSLRTSEFGRPLQKERPAGFVSLGGQWQALQVQDAKAWSRRLDQAPGKEVNTLSGTVRPAEVRRILENPPWDAVWPAGVDQRRSERFEAENAVAQGQPEAGGQPLQATRHLSKIEGDALRRQILRLGDSLSSWLVELEQLESIRLQAASLESAAGGLREVAGSRRCGMAL